MATGGAPFDDGTEELHSWTAPSCSLEDRLNNTDWGVQKKKANRSSEKNRKKLSASVVESRLTNDISPESTPGAGRRRARTPHSFPHVKYTTQMSVPDQAELDKLRQRINFTDMDERSIGSDSQGRATAANNQRQLAGENKKPYNFLPLHVNTNKSRDLLGPSSSAPATPAISQEDAPWPSRGGNDRGAGVKREPGRGDQRIDSSQVVSKLVQIREYISKASSMRDDLVEKNDVPANVERLSHLIDHLKQQEKSYLRFLQKMLVKMVQADQMEELENLRKQHELLKKMLEQQQQLRALQGRQEALMAMQESAEQAISAIEDTVVTDTTGSVSGLSITSELNEELNDLIQRFHNQLHDSRTKAVPDNRRQAESLSLSREHRPLLHSASGPHTDLDPEATAASAKLTKLQELQDKKQTMDKILQELHSLRDQTLNNSSCRGFATQCSLNLGGSSDCSALCTNGASASTAFHPALAQHQDGSSSKDKLRKLKEVHKRLNELRELVQYYEQTSDMMVDAVNENVKDDDDDEEEEESEQDNRHSVTNIRNSQRGGNWVDLNSLTNGHGVRGSASDNQDGRLNTDCEINNRSTANLRSPNIPSTIACQYNRDTPYNEGKDDDPDEDEDVLDNEEGARAAGPDSEGSSRRSSLGNAGEFVHKVHQQKVKQKLRQLQELMAMVQSDDTDGTTANEDDVLHQQPNNTRAGSLGTISKPSPPELSLSSKAREKLYEEKIRQQKQELKQLHDEHKRLTEIQGKIRDLQWACPDLQVSASVCSAGSQQGLLRLLFPPGPKLNGTILRKTAPEPAVPPAADSELWSEMRRHQMLREELRQRRKHLEYLIAEHQRRSGLTDSPQHNRESLASPSHTLSRDERTLATWGCNSMPTGEEDDEYNSEMMLPAKEERRSRMTLTRSSSDDDIQIYTPSRNQNSYSNRKNQGSSNQNPPLVSEDGGGHTPLRNKTKAQEPQQSANQGGGARRQENVRWATELSFAEGSRHWQEQVSQLQRQLDFSTSMCQTLLQDQQTLSYMLQTLLTGQYSVLPNNLSSPQVHLVMHQLNQCYTQLAWQQNNVQRLKQVMNELLCQQQQSSPAPAGWQTQKQSSFQESGCPPSAGVAPTFSSLLNPLANNMAASPMPSFSHSLNSLSLFPAPMGEFAQGAAGQASPVQQKQQLDPNTSVKTEYMSFPPPLQRSPLNTTAERGWVQHYSPLKHISKFCFLLFFRTTGWQKTSNANNIVHCYQSKTQRQNSRSTSPAFSPERSPPQQFDRVSQGSYSSLADPVDPTTITKTYRAGRKASAQANLAARSKTPNKARRRLNKGRNKNNEVSSGPVSDSVGSTADFVQRRAPLPRQKDQNKSLLDKLTQEKLDSKSKFGKKRNDLSSDASSDFSLFETLRETIYSEVATLISQNESRPHFLIELFHELQLLNTDYLRQRALFSLQDIVTRHLTEKNAADDPSPPRSPVAWAADSQSELTPSESLASSDAEVVEKNLKRRRVGAESVDSSVSASSNLEPFANDELGNPVLHLDKALARVRKYERVKLESELSPRSASPAGVSELSNAEHPSADKTEGTVIYEAARRQPPPQPGQGASAEVRCPQIDTQQLDCLIKAIIAEVISFFKENMHKVCSLQLLTLVRRLVLNLIQQHDESREFVQFFHKQLGGILQDTLSKFEGRTLKDCGEDLLVEISEILFNELAFFRLMQDLDSKSVAKHKSKQPGDLGGPTRPGAKQLLGDKSVSPAYTEEDKEQDEAQEVGRTLQESHSQTERKSSKSEGSGEDEDEGRGENSPLLISLPKAETQALTNYDSREVDNEEEETEESEARPADVQTSADGQLEPERTTGGDAGEETTEERSSENEGGLFSLRHAGGRSASQPHLNSFSLFLPETNESIEMMDATVVECVTARCQSPEAEAAAPADGAPAGSEGQQVTTPTSSPDTNSPVMVSVEELGSGSNGQRSDEEDFVKVDDLPLQLTVMCEEELQKRIVEEQQNNNLSMEILNGNAETVTGLVGNAQALKEPDTAGAENA
uniref:Pericentriolar material 1 n=1 Tax=Tetraodon nigroviridis TaxID=99883 RepID=H3C0I3_TETNG